MQPPLDDLRERLLRAGLAPRHVRRYVAELRDHLADLTAHERSAGFDVQTAAERAAARLGSIQQLTQAMIDRTPRSLTARAPWAVIAMFPVMLLLCVHWGTAVSLMHVLAPVRGLAPGSMPGSYRGLIATVSLVATYLMGPLVLSGCLAIALRQRLSSRWIALGLALVAVFSAVFGFHMQEIPATADRQAGAVFSMVDFVYRQGRVSVSATLGLALLRASLLFALSIVAYRALSHRLVKVRATHGT